MGLILNCSQLSESIFCNNFPKKYVELCKIHKEGRNQGKIKKKTKKISTLEKPDFRGFVSYTRSYTQYAQFKALNYYAIFGEILNKCFVKL